MLVRWTAPTRQLDGWRQFNRIFDETFGALNGNGRPIEAWNPAVDVAEGPKSYTISLEIPGVKPEAIKINLDGRQLTVTGEKKQETEEAKDRVHRFERRYGSFTRTFTLPETVNGDQIEAKAEAGVLKLTLPKTEKAQPKAIPVAVG